MSFIQTVLLGAIAGFTIYLGLPLGRIKKISAGTRTFLSMTSAGILLFILFDVLSNFSKPIKAAITERKNFPEFFILLGVFVVGFGLGLLGLIAFDQRFMRAPAGSNKPVDPTRLALMIATGIGLHNFSEGLAIGQSAGRGESVLLRCSSSALDCITPRKVLGLSVRWWGRIALRGDSSD